MSWETAGHCPQPPWLLTQRGHLTSPWGTSPASLGQVCPMVHCSDGARMAQPMLFCAPALTVQGQVEPCPALSDLLLGWCKAQLRQWLHIAPAQLRKRKGFLLSHLSNSTSVQSQGVTGHWGRIKLARSGAGRACWEQAAEWSCATKL